MISAWHSITVTVLETVKALLIHILSVTEYGIFINYTYYFFENIRSECLVLLRNVSNRQFF